MNFLRAGLLAKKNLTRNGAVTSTCCAALCSLLMTFVLSPTVSSATVGVRAPVLAPTVTSLGSARGLGRDSECSGERTVICHREGKHGCHSISVCEPALAAHVAHGDTIGECLSNDDAACHDDADSDLDSDSDSDGIGSGDADSDSDVDIDSDSDSDSDRGKPGEDCLPEPLSCSTNADCSDGDSCNGEELCDDGCCHAAAPLACDDGLYCNGEERCDPASGCLAGTPPCDDGIACTQDCCHEDTRECGHAPADARCDDGNACNGAEHCDVDAGCQFENSEVDCTELDSVCGAGVCDESDGSCIVEPANEGGTCDDGDDLCTFSDRCAGGHCLGTPVCDPECERCDAGECISLCGNPFDPANDEVRVTDALYTLRASVDLESCPACICDVNSDGVIGSTDALRVLWRVVRLPITLDCPAPGSMSSTTTLGSVSTTTLLE